MIEINVAPLRDKPEDIPVLAQHFVNQVCKRNKRDPLSISRQLMDKMMSYSWPGNIRELSNVVERLVVLSRGDVISESHFTESLIEGAREKNIVIPVGTSLEEIEKIFIKETLDYSKGNKKMAADLLGINQRTIYRKLEPSDPGQ